MDPKITRVEITYEDGSARYVDHEDATIVGSAVEHWYPWHRTAITNWRTIPPGRATREELVTVIHDLIDASVWGAHYDPVEFRQLVADANNLLAWEGGE